MSDHRTDIVKGALAGLAAGLVASLAMEGFQRLIGSGDNGGEPATEKVADATARRATGHALTRAERPAAGEAVHYLTGAGLGVIYGIAAELVPDVTRGAGTAFSSAVAATLDEGLVPALGFGSAPWRTPPAGHATSLSSHLVFGVVAEATRRAARSMLDRALP